jgi:hypothetical protein
MVVTLVIARGLVGSTGVELGSTTRGKRVVTESPPGSVAVRLTE